MSKFIEIIKSLLPSNETQRARDEAYLAQAVDIYDLERRMEEIDRRSQPTQSALAYPQGLR
jgi:Protein of unknown function (DUF3563)